MCTATCALMCGIVSTKRDLMHCFLFFSSRFQKINYIAEVPLTHHFLRTENRSIGHGVIRL